jgi:hypothetical protein
MPRQKAGTKFGPVSSPISISNIDDQIKIKILDAFDTYSKSGGISDDDKEIFWAWVLDRLAIYRGEIKTGLPSTPGERKSRIRKVRELARKLEKELGRDDDYHTYRTLSEMLSIEGGSMSDLEHNLFKLRCLSTNETYNMIDNDGNKWLHHVNGPPKADPYLYDLMEMILWRWYQLTNRVPTIGGGEYGKPKTGPVLRWLEEIFLLIDKKPPRDDFKEIAEAIKAQHKKDGKNLKKS